MVKGKCWKSGRKLWSFTIGLKIHSPAAKDVLIPHSVICLYYLAYNMMHLMHVYSFDVVL